MTKEEIQFGESCGLVYTQDKEFAWIGNNQSWSNFNDGEGCTGHMPEELMRKEEV